MDVALSALPKRMTLEDLGVLPLRVSPAARVAARPLLPTRPARGE